MDSIEAEPLTAAGGVSDTRAAGIGPAPIFFCHVPKTAGTSLHTVFDGHFRDDQVLISDNRLNQLRVYFTPFRYLAGLRYIGGHFHDSLCAEKIGPAVRITTLRDPLDRLSSFMNHSLRGNGPHARLFSEFAEDNQEPLIDFLKTVWPISTSPLVYLTPQRALPKDLPLSDDRVDAIVAHVRANYEFVFASDGVDALADALLPPSPRHQNTRQMVGEKLGGYRAFKGMFNDAVRTVLRPDIRLHEALKQDPPGAGRPVTEVLAPRPRQVWYLDWDQPQAARGFQKRRTVAAPETLVPEMRSRLLAERYGSLFVSPGFVPRRFSALLQVSAAIVASQGIILRNGDDPIPFRFRALNSQTLFLFGEVPDGMGLETEWSFDVESDGASRRAWLHDFVLYG